MSAAQPCARTRAELALEPLRIGDRRVGERLEPGRRERRRRRTGGGRAAPCRAPSRARAAACPRRASGGVSSGRNTWWTISTCPRGGCRSAPPRACVSRASRTSSARGCAARCRRGSSSPCAAAPRRAGTCRCRRPARRSRRCWSVRSSPWTVPFASPSSPAMSTTPSRRVRPESSRRIAAARSMD